MDNEPKRIDISIIYHPKEDIFSYLKFDWEVTADTIPEAREADTIGDLVVMLEGWLDSLRKGP